MKLNFVLNGVKREWEVTPNDFLADILRDHGVASLKIGCHDGVCGTCTVLFDGKPILSCECLALRAEGHEITTVEGLGEEGDRIAQYLVELGGEGCGYCAPAYVVMTYALRRELKDPTYEEVKHYLNNNLCRCTGYHTRVESALRYIQAENEREKEEV